MFWMKYLLIGGVTRQKCEASNLFLTHIYRIGVNIQRELFQKSLDVNLTDDGIFKQQFERGLSWPGDSGDIPPRRGPVRCVGPWVRCLGS